MKILKPKLTDTKIRLIILSAYYNSQITGEKPLQAKIPQLENIDYKIINWHFIWLIEHNFLRGKITEVTAGSIASISRISRDGIDLIEKIAEKESLNLNSELSHKIDNTNTIKEKSSIFCEFLLEGMKLTNNILTLANKFFGS